MEANIQEIWKDVVGYEGRYEISSLGSVKSLNYNKTGKPKLLAKIFHHSGYLCTCLNRGGKVKWIYVHRLVAIAFIPNPNGYDQVNHINSNKSDPRLENLEWCNQSQNRRHAQDAGFVFIPKGQEKWQAKLKDSDIPKIRNLSLSGLDYPTIAKMFNVSRQAIGFVVTRKTWSHIK